ncbi:MAG: hypothetical protein ACRDIE_07495 [Chloroflexota bacterium]
MPDWRDEIMTGDGLPIEIVVTADIIRKRLKGMKRDDAGGVLLPMELYAKTLRHYVDELDRWAHQNPLLRTRLMNRCPGYRHYCLMRSLWAEGKDARRFETDRVETWRMPTELIRLLLAEPKD